MCQPAIVDWGPCRDLPLKLPCDQDLQACWSEGKLYAQAPRAKDDSNTLLLCVMFARPSELRSVLQGLIPVLILSQKCHTIYVHMGPICNGCWVWSSWSVVGVRWLGVRVIQGQLCFRKQTEQSFRTVITVQRAVTVNMSFSYEEYTDMHFVYGVCNVNTTAAVEEYRLQYPRRRILERRVFTRIHQHLRIKVPFQM